MSSPDGGIIYEVGDSECLISIASDHGFYWKTLWNHPKNADLKNLRKDPNVLLKGDQVFIPDLTPRIETKSAGARHTYKKNGIPAIARFCMQKEGEPLAGLRYVAEIDGIAVDGTTDSDGIVELKIPPGAKDILLRITHADQSVEVHRISMGGLDPATEDSGIRQRLKNMGFPCADDGSDFAQALSLYQQNNQMNVTGTLDDDTRNAIVKAHGS